MSRVHKPAKYVNSARYDDSVYNPSKIKRIHSKGEDYHKCSTLSHWLFIKYDIDYDTYRKKRKNTRNRLRLEFEQDTGKAEAYDENEIAKR